MTPSSVLSTSTRSNLSVEPPARPQTGRASNRILPRANKLGGRHKPIYVPDADDAAPPRSKPAEASADAGREEVIGIGADADIKLLTAVKHRVELTLLDFLVDYERRIWISNPTITEERAPPNEDERATEEQTPPDEPPDEDEPEDEYEDEDAFAYSPTAHMIPIPDTFELPPGAPPTEYLHTTWDGSSRASSRSRARSFSTAASSEPPSRPDSALPPDDDGPARTPRKKKKKKPKSTSPLPTSSPLPASSLPLSSASSALHSCAPAASCTDPFCLHRAPSPLSTPPSPLLELERLVADLPRHPAIDVARMMRNLRRMVAIHAECDAEVVHSQAALRMEGDSVDEVALRLDLVQGCERRLERLRAEYMRRLKEVQRSIDCFRESAGVGAQQQVPTQTL